MKKKKRYETYFKRDGFIQVIEPDIKCLSKLINKAKGDLSIEKFAYICGVSPKKLNAIVSGKKKNLDLGEIFLIAMTAPESSGATFPLFLAANGMINMMENQDYINDSIDRLTALRKRILDPASSGETDISSDDSNNEMENPVSGISRDGDAENRESTNRSQQLEEMPEEMSRLSQTWESFINNLSFYSRSVSLDTVLLIYKNMDKLYQDIEFKRNLGFYVYYTKKDAQNLEQTFRNIYTNSKNRWFHFDMLNLPEAAASSYRKALDATIEELQKTTL